jgi:D,D-heptose 1,7-bisphosphate phosphatase
MRPAVFIDKDGTLVEDVPYNVDPVRVRLAAGALPALRRVADAGFALVVVTNQSGIARGFYPESAVETIGRHLTEVLARDGVTLDAFLYCPHLPDAAVAEYRLACDCRKPEPGLIRRACAELGLAGDRSWMLGDIATDVLAGQAAGCRTVLVNPHPEPELAQLSRKPDLVAHSLPEAADALLSATLSRDVAPVQPS